MEWTTNTFNEFNGRQNDVVQLDSGFLLNVHQSPDDDSLWYVLGEFDEKLERVVWRTDTLTANNGHCGTTLFVIYKPQQRPPYMLV